ncbi:type I-B CRISPR-associated protein Cas8b/Csh1 [Eubacterium multiforme]|uniref:CRISPR-associated protein Csh1 n=1 Tax=Eubacterium multiforme TaxID=83339 RepID=A0ABT9UNW1_9FIRM|nr:type I-B CRISPR-associated protein Cas8b/Csh1 [Eubacterium multiforme]MDQ0148328.1 CRISPR-associated protein Csh1 [Eubacterium multiforme]
MISKVMDSIKSIKKDHLDDVILDGYVPADGTYIIIEPDEAGNLHETFRTDILIDKKTKTLDRTIDKFSLLCKLDYNSKLIDMNKPIDGKKIIHSNNYLSFFLKKESLIEDSKTKKRKLTEEIIDNYYKTLENPLIKYEKKPKAKALYLNIEEELGEVDKEKILQIKNWIKENIFNLNIDSSKNYLKIFFLYDEDSFENESKRYLIPNVYNNNDFNIETEEGIIGLPNDNMGLNSKKPYLENKTRKVKVPYLINQEEVLLQKKIFDYLFNLASEGKYNIYIGEDDIKALKDGEALERNFSGMYLRIKKGKETEIIDSDVIANYSPYLKTSFEFKNVLDIDTDTLYKNKKEDVEEYDKKIKLRDIESLINIFFFNRFLIKNYFSEDIPIKEEAIKRALLMSRNKLGEWFYKGNNNNLWNVLNKSADLVIKSNLENGYFIKAMNEFNLKYSLKEYLVKGDENMADILSSIKDNLRIKIFEKGDSKIDNDNEYFFAVGQLTGFLLGKSKGKNKPLSLANPIINAKNNELIKRKLQQLYMKYNYDLELDKDVRFKNLYSMIIGYEIEGNINKDLIIAGYLSNNIIYEKKES